MRSCDDKQTKSFKLLLHIKQCARISLPPFCLVHSETIFLRIQDVTKLTESHGEFDQKEKFRNDLGILVKYYAVLQPIQPVYKVNLGLKVSLM